MSNAPFESIARDKPKNHPMKTKIILPLVIAITFVFSEAAHATVLIPPSGSLPPDVFGGCTGCTLLATNDTGLVVVSPTLSFDLVSAVYSDPNNTFGAGGLDFVYQVTNEASSTGSIGRVTATDFTGFQTDVGYNFSGSTFPTSPFATDGTVAPILVDRNTASTIGFSFGGGVFAPITPGSSSNVLEIQTDATNFQAGKVSVIDGGTTTVNAFAPAAAATATPDTGTTVSLFGLSLAGLVFFRRKIAA